jgi:UDP-glucose 4-epimerase
MKKILITGANSYIGTSFEKYIKENYPNDYVVDTIDMIDGTWREKSFAGYDSVFHVAGIAHSDNGKISAKKEKLYYAVNTDLTVETAKKTKVDGVKQFIFMSSAIVYGDSAPIGKSKVITRDTPVSPANCYGDSKVQAENGIRPLNDDNFNVVILRPPMIYGKGSKGNYPLLAKIAMKTPIFPMVKNTRSMLYIENLCEFVRLMVENDEQGPFWPQNSEYSNTSELVGLIAEAHCKKVRLVKGCGWALKIISHVTALVNKAFGRLSYDREMSEYRDGHGKIVEYRKVDLKESIRRTEI